MTVVCRSCGGPAETHDVDGVELTVCLDCDCIRCQHCGVPVTDRTATKCPQGHRL